MEYSKHFGPSNVKSIFENILSYPIIKTVITVAFTAWDFVFKSQEQALIVVFSLIALDTVTGIAKAIKRKELGSEGFGSFLGKIFIYLILMATGNLVDQVLPVKVGANAMYIFLGCQEALSIMENISLLGFPVPSKLINVLKKVQQEDKKK